MGPVESLPCVKPRYASPTAPCLCSICGFLPCARSANVLIAIVGGRPQAKVSDLGLAKELLLGDGETVEAAGGGDEHTLGVGTLRYMAPERVLPSLGPTPFTRGQYSTACDVYSFGSLLWEVRSNALRIHTTCQCLLQPNARLANVSPRGDSTVLESTHTPHVNVSQPSHPPNCR